MKALLRQSVSDGRYRHAIATADTAKEIASWLNIDTDKAWIAGLLHDCAKFDDDPNTYLAMAKDAGLSPTQDQMTDPCLFLHAHLSAYVAARDYNVVDIEILNAIRLHQTGAYSMTALDKIIIISDWTEPTRKQLGEIRELAKSDLDEAFFRIYSHSIMNVIQKELKFFDGVSDIYNVLWDKRNEQGGRTE